MLKIRFLALATTLLLGLAPALAGELNCQGPTGSIEEFRYTWRLRGGLSWLAGLVVPTAGAGHLRTVFATEASPSVSSELLITAPKGRSDGFFHYTSEMDHTGQKTLKSMSAYAFGSKAREVSASFDYARGVARVRKETPEKVEYRTRPLPDTQLRDVLTAILFLRRNAGRITRPITTDIYSDGKEYPVVFRPIGRKTFTIGGRGVSALGFEIIDAPGGKKWPGDVRVYVSDDARRIPFQIDINRSIASVQLELKSIEACAGPVSQAAGLKPQASGEAGRLVAP